MNFKIDKCKCTKCKLCTMVCPVMIIDHKTEYPTIKEDKKENCLKCQHCLAVCPTGALSIWDKTPDNSISTSAPLPKSENLVNLMKTRRSIRKFANEAIDKTLIHHLISTASFAPTAKNENAVQFTVIENRKDMSNLRELVYSSIKYANEKNKLSESQMIFNNFQELWYTKKIDILFRDAPHLLITSAPVNGAASQMDCTIAMTWFEILANTNGLGTLWNGFLQSVLKNVIPEIKTKINIPDDHLISAVLLFGKPGIKYARSIQNNNPNIKTVKFD